MSESSAGELPNLSDASDPSDPANPWTRATPSTLSNQARRALRAQAHGLKPVVWVASSGATPGVLRELDRALNAHELVKIHAAVDGRAMRAELLASICAQLCAQPVQIIGKMLVAFRPRPAPPEGQPRSLLTRTSTGVPRATSKSAPRRPPRTSSR